MIDTILATLTPMATLFLCIAIGFALGKTKLLPESSGAVIAKLSTWVIFPALSFYTMANFFTIESLAEHGTNMIFACVACGLSMAMAIVLSSYFAKKKSYEIGVYQYALTFGNSGYMGDPIVLALFGVEALAYYKMFCLPLTIVIYTWGTSRLVPKGKNKSSLIKSIFNPPTIGLLVGVAFGLLGITQYVPAFVMGAVSSIKDCMGPMAMLLAGITISRFNFLGMLKNKKVYWATLLRLIVLPSILIGAIFGLKELVNLVFSLSIGNNVLYYLIFAFATPLGMNTIVFPEAYGGDAETGASMVMISHTLCVLTIPVVCAVVSMLFGAFVI